MCWSLLIVDGSVTLSTEPRPLRTSWSVTMKSGSNWICSSFSCNVILASRAFTRLSTGRAEGCPAGRDADAAPLASRLKARARTATTASSLRAVRCCRKRNRVIEDLLFEGRDLPTELTWSRSSPTHTVNTIEVVRRELIGLCHHHRVDVHVAVAVRSDHLRPRRLAHWARVRRCVSHPSRHGSDRLLRGSSQQRRMTPR